MAAREIWPPAAPTCPHRSRLVATSAHARTQRPSDVQHSTLRTDHMLSFPYCHLCARRQACLAGKLAGTYPGHWAAAGPSSGLPPRPLEPGLVLQPCGVILVRPNRQQRLRIALVAHAFCTLASAVACGPCSRFDACGAAAGDQALCWQALNHCTGAALVGCITSIIVDPHRGPTSLA